MAMAAPITKTDAQVIPTTAHHVRHTMIHPLALKTTVVTALITHLKITMTAVELIAGAMVDTAAATTTIIIIIMMVVAVVAVGHQGDWMLVKAVDDFKMLFRAQ